MEEVPDLLYDDSDWQEALSTSCPFVRGGVLHVNLRDLSGFLALTQPGQVKVSDLRRLMQRVGAVCGKEQVNTAKLGRVNRNYWKLPPNYTPAGGNTTTPL